MPPGSGDPSSDKDAGLHAGDLVAGHYRVERVIGSGGMGVVVAARDERSGEEVAVKVLRSVEDTRAVERFFREARAMGQLDSEHVVRVRDAGSDGNKPYLVMDRLHGMDLAARTRLVGRLAPREAADHVIEACEALSHAHSKGIVHRDVKPSNLFLHIQGNTTVLKVLDFGISKVQTRDVWERTLTVTDDGGVLGSPPYMSPEQVRDPKAVDPRSDVWSLGVVLYKILSGTVPYDGESVGEVFAKVLERPYPPLRATIPEALDDVVKHCLEKNREDRFSHVGELALALAPFASPARAALAPRIAQRMNDEGPTLERPSSTPDLITGPGKGDPSTLSLSGPPPALPPQSAPALSHVPVPVPVPVPDLPLADPRPPRRARVALLLVAIGVLGGSGIGLLLLRSSSSTSSSASSQPEPSPPTVLATPAPLPAASTSTTLALTPAPPSATPSISASASAPPKAVRLKPGTRRPVTTTAASAPATAPRPELQPSPYPTPP